MPSGWRSVSLGDWCARPHRESSRPATRPSPASAPWCARGARNVASSYTTPGAGPGPGPDGTASRRERAGPNGWRALLHSTWCWRCVARSMRGPSSGTSCWRPTVRSRTGGRPWRPGSSVAPAPAWSSITPGRRPTAATCSISASPTATRGRERPPTRCSAFGRCLRAKGPSSSRSSRWEPDGRRCSSAPRCCSWPCWVTAPAGGWAARRSSR